MYEDVPILSLLKIYIFHNIILCHNDVDEFYEIWEIVIKKTKKLLLLGLETLLWSVLNPRFQSILTCMLCKIYKYFYDNARFIQLITNYMVHLVLDA